MFRSFARGLSYSGREPYRPTDITATASVDVVLEIVAEHKEEIRKLAQYDPRFLMPLNASEIPRP
jgi:hypothetical protein